MLTANSERWQGVGTQEVGHHISLKVVHGIDAGIEAKLLHGVDVAS